MKWRHPIYILFELIPDTVCHTFYHCFRRDTRVLMHPGSLRLRTLIMLPLKSLCGSWAQFGSSTRAFCSHLTLSWACVHGYEWDRVYECVCRWTAHITQVNCSAWVNESHCVHPSTANLKRLSHVLPPTYVCCRAPAAVAQWREGNLIAEFKNRKQGSSSTVEDYSHCLRHKNCLVRIIFLSFIVFRYKPLVKMFNQKHH